MHPSRPSCLACRPGIALLLAWLVAGCAAPAGVTVDAGAAVADRLPATADPYLELTETPFFAQDSYQCGPAALAMVLVETGVEVTPEALVSRVYIPSRRGSLQHEIVATARSFDRVPYVIDADLGALIAQLEAGLPVLVLQNLRWVRLPQWHYAIVVGYDRVQQTLILRSGLEKRHVTTVGEFDRSWRRAGRWGLVLLRPGALPANADPDRLLRTVAAIEEQGNPDVAASAYAAMVRRWPEHPGIRFGLAHTRYLAGDYRAAAQEYRELLDLTGPDPLVLNNLARALLRGACPQAAFDAIRRALEEMDRLGNGNDDLARVTVTTHQEIRAALAAGAIDTDDACGK